VTDNSPSGLSRRDVLTAAAALPWLTLPGACVSVRRQPAEVVFADMHIHLFNAHDLPAGKFLVEVLFRKQQLPRLLKAVIDTIVRRIQPRAISALREKARLEGAALVSEDLAEWTPERFGAEVGAWARNRVDDETTPNPFAAPVDDGETGLGLFADAAEMRAAYDELIAAVVNEGESSAEAVVQGREQQSTAVDRAFARLAQQAETPQVSDVGEISEAVVPTLPASPVQCGAESCPERPYSMSVPAILRYLGWGYLMLKSREAHLNDYARMSRARGERPGLVLHHLVDYDEWLGSGRLPGSSHSDQVEVADSLSRVFAVARPGRPAIELKTFAGFCPLKHALEVRRSGRPVSFEAQLTQVAQGKITGFKLYPPMGFQAWGNSALQNRDFNPSSAYRVRHFRRWSGEFGSSPDGHEIGAAIDASLRSFFTVCAAEDIPLMAHAGPGNEAGPDFGQRANPRHWYHVAKEYRLRLSLGHLVNSAEDFVCALRAGRSPECVWALGASRLLLDPAHPLRSRVWGDLGFMPELIESPALAAEFFYWLKLVYGPQDPKLTRILYGSDYVMVGAMARYGRHLSAMRAGMNAASYDQETIDNILISNGRRFLTRMT